MSFILFLVHFYLMLTNMIFLYIIVSLYNFRERMKNEKKKVL